MSVTLYNSVKAMFIGFLAFCISGPIAVSIPFLLKGAHSSFLLGAIVFFAIPLISFPFIKKKCLSKAILTLSDTSLKLQTDGQETSAYIKWGDIKNYQIQPFNNLSGSGFTLKIIGRDAQVINMNIYGENVWHIDDLKKETSVVIKLSRLVYLYNITQPDDESQIILLPAFFASDIGSYLLWLPLALIMMDLLYRVSHPGAMNKDILFFLSAIMISVVFLGQRTKDKQVYEKLLRLQKD